MKYQILLVAGMIAGGIPLAAEAHPPKHGRPHHDAPTAVQVIDSVAHLVRAVAPVLAPPPPPVVVTPAPPPPQPVVVTPAPMVVTPAPAPVVVTPPPAPAPVVVTPAP
ncbi:MAG: hypothetical protein J6R85_01295, partial [Lentisphaeria bacterium]|nr:hypothetical protein [Lentisphaeria bacterium]